MNEGVFLCCLLMLFHHNTTTDTGYSESGPCAAESHSARSVSNTTIATTTFVYSQIHRERYTSAYRGVATVASAVTA